MGWIHNIIAAGLSVGPSGWRAVPFALAPLVGVFGMTRLWAEPAAWPAVEGGAPRFAIVCSKCLHRTDCDAPPGDEVEHRAGKLRCGACGAFAAAWYRRGGLSVPPGGW
jgi:hypothetical protein